MSKRISKPARLSKEQLSAKLGELSDDLPA